ncbi:hypothetical protein AB0C01_07455 [Micromonospora sp. NPDC048905]|uniref:helix-turn-helix transcriptional regulator n=1 Tax=Micromonospora sp. NPDC048905 TaxID=3155494 RepID=UPI00340A51AA
MEIRAAILDPLPLYCDGVAAALKPGGYIVERPPDIWGWLADTGRQIVLLSLSDSVDWQLLADLHLSRPDVHILALVGELTTASCARALIAGAAGALARDVSANMLRSAFEQLSRGQAVLPVEVLTLLTGSSTDRARATTGNRPDEAPEIVPSPQERDWLRRLATGATVAQLAQAAGYSERMMHRLLRSLYGRMAASSRTEALIRARDLGWI